MASRIQGMCMANILRHKLKLHLLICCSVFIGRRQPVNFCHLICDLDPATFQLHLVVNARLCPLKYFQPFWKVAHFQTYRWPCCRLELSGFKGTNNYQNNTIYLVHRQLCRQIFALYFISINRLIRSRLQCIILWPVFGCGNINCSRVCIT